MTDANEIPEISEEAMQAMIQQIENQNMIENEKWLKYDRQLIKNWNEKVRKFEEQEKLKEQARARIAEEFERDQKRIADLAAEIERQVEEKRVQDAQLLAKIGEYINGSGDLPAELYGIQEMNPSKPTCSFYDKVGICRYGLTCERNHKRPKISRFLLVPAFFTNIGLNNTGRASEYGDDLSIEYDEHELYRAFEEFFQDVEPEFEKFGRIVQFRVCQNVAKFLRGNVYVEYKSQRWEEWPARAPIFQPFDSINISYVYLETQCGHTKTCTDVSMLAER